MTLESIPPSEADGKNDPPLERPRYQVHRLYNAEEIRREMLGEEPESPPGGIELKIPLGAIPSLPQLIPAISEAVGVVRLPEVQAAIDAATRISLEQQAAIDAARISAERAADRLYTQIAPSMAEVNARLERTLEPMRSAMNANMGAALYEHRLEIDAMKQMAVQASREMVGSLGSMEAAIAGTVVSLRPLGMRLDIGRVGMAESYISAAAPQLKLQLSNPVYMLFYAVFAQQDGWEDALDALARRPELALAPEAEWHARSGLDVYRDGLLAQAQLPLVKAALLGAILDEAGLKAISPSELIPYLRERVRNGVQGDAVLRLLRKAERGNGHLLLPGGVLIDNVPKKSATRPVGSKEYWHSKDDFVAAVRTAIKALVEKGEIIRQERVYEYLAGHMTRVPRPHAQNGYSLRQFQRDREDYGFSNWEHLRDVCMD